MLAHSPHLPIIIIYTNDTRFTPTEDEEGIILALQHRHRVRHIYLLMPGSDLCKLVPAIDGEFPMLGSLLVGPSQEDPDKANLMKRLQAPHLRELVLMNTDLSPVLQILTSSISLVTLVLHEIYPAYFSTHDLLQHLSLLPRLKLFIINFHDDASNVVIERQLLDAPAMTHVTFPDLRQFQFGDMNAYLEALLSHMTTPILEMFSPFLTPSHVLYGKPLAIHEHNKEPRLPLPISNSVTRLLL